MNLRRTVPYETGKVKMSYIFKDYRAVHASTYGTTKAAKTRAFTIAAKDQTHEAHARELMGRQIRPRILDDEFPDYQKLLDDAEIEPSPLHPARPHYSPGDPLHIGAKTRRCAT